MLDDMLKGCGMNCDCGCHENPKPKKCATSCDVLWMIVLLMIVLKGGCFGLDLCTLLILLIVFGKDIFCKFRNCSCGNK